MIINVPMAIDLSKDSIHPISSMEVIDGEVVEVTVLDDDLSELMTLEKGEFQLIEIESQEQLKETIERLQELWKRA